MFPASTHKGQAVYSFPDVCKTPSPGGPVPIPYPNMGTSSTGSKASSTKVTIQSPSINTRSSSLSRMSGDEAGSVAGLKSSLSMIHQKLMTMPAGNTTAWHETLDVYVQTCANLYKALDK